MNPYGKQVLAKGSSHPCLSMNSHPACTIRHLLSPIVAWTFQRVKLSSREMPAVLHSHLCCGAAHAPEESSCRFLPFANQANLPARLIVSDVNYRMCAFVHSGACCHDDLCSRKY